ncbi:MAG TPA: hypothetical protein VNK95_02855 [Caldilineaceae bacterium]|nr:hypothetical protein [Caldilineaceae bacterium]
MEGSPRTPTDHLALVVPPGLPPGEYRLLLGVGPPGSEVLFSATAAAGTEAVLLPLATLAVAAPAQPVAPARLPMEAPLAPPWQDQGITLLGHSGAPPQSRWLAGTSLAVTLFARSDQAAPPARQLRLALLDNEGNGAAGWEGWPLPNYPPNAWTEGALVQLPVLLDLPATLGDGSYRLVAGLTDPAGDEPPPPADLTIIQVYRRPMSFTRPSPAHPLAEPVQFGAHAHLIGYTISDTMNSEDGASEDGASEHRTLLVALDWEVTQTLLPPHHLFVHLTTPDGALVAQSDGPPVTVEGAAPSGSWLPGEFLRTLTYVELPDELPAPVEALALRVGLYEPESQVRLPASQGGRPIGDAAVLPLRP